MLGQGTKKTAIFSLVSSNIDGKERKTSKRATREWRCREPHAPTLVLRFSPQSSTKRGTVRSLGTSKS